MTFPSVEGFNEAAGFTRRKPPSLIVGAALAICSFNEAAGFTRRKPARRVGMAPEDIAMLQ